MSFIVCFLGVPPRSARGRAAAGFAGAPSRLWRDRPFGAPSASLTQGGGACGAAALETYTNHGPAFGVTTLQLRIIYTGLIPAVAPSIKTPAARVAALGSTYLCCTASCFLMSRKKLNRFGIAERSPDRL
jgi:hypothetical protein